MAPAMTGIRVPEAARFACVPAAGAILADRRAVVPKMEQQRALGAIA